MPLRKAETSSGQGVGGVERWEKNLSTPPTLLHLLISPPTLPTLPTQHPAPCFAQRH